MMQPVLDVRGLTKNFSGVRALDDVDLVLQPGEIHCLAGENGSGKSTLIKLISGVHQPDGGEIILDGRSYRGLTPIEAMRGGVQVIYQDFSIFPNLTVMENLALTSEISARRRLVNWKRFREIAERAIATIDFSVDLDAKVGDLSVADKQLIAICRALLTETKLIIMDEPTTALTHREVEALFKVITDLRSRGIATLFVSHKLDEVFEISERFTILRNGRLVATAETSELDHRSFARHMTGREFSDEALVPAGEPGGPVLEVEDLCLEDAFQDISFTLRRGEVLGITGLLGSGRTELALTLFGVFRADAGRLVVNGTPAELRSIRDAIARGIAYVPEDRLTEGLMLDRSIADNIVVAELDELSSALGVLDAKRRDEEVLRWVEELRIATADPDNAVRTLSGGNQQRVVLAKWLAREPEVLILNGPTVGVDIGSKSDIHELLRRLADGGMGIIVISDDTQELLRVCNRILLLREGRLVEELDPAGLTQLELSARITADENGEA
ncbi:MAG: sugar ABC transporter ATP-binding protein [Arachnia propionica]|uniref:sugar ABC transporter ATP-binding protein n=1 Tax=Arachnia propionica TaxID=1750 RepID=UPI002710B86E|nr:sugar ABC transporter ATP-binding protein [Arachnia propionica]